MSPTRDTDDNGHLLTKHKVRVSFIARTERTASGPGGGEFDKVYLLRIVDLSFLKVPSAHVLL